MTKTYSTQQQKEKAVLVTVEVVGRDSWPLDRKVEELERLVDSCGVDIMHSEYCRRNSLDPKYYIGTGRVEEIGLLAERSEADVVIFSNDLTPSQQKNLEKAFGRKVLDRTQLILDIFASRATSAEGKVQVELAQLVYLLPRLSRMWLHLGKQRGGIGTRGPGEQQLEVDRRKVRERISRLKRELKDITKKRHLRRMQREKYSRMTIALVGYTNSGKSTLFNAITSSGVVARNQLFSTLDPTVRKITLSSSQTVLLSDTVGFLHDLPHHLIESFKATLEEVVDADILFHVMDMSDELLEERVAAVRRVLDELGVGEKPVVVVLNKADKVDSPLEVSRIAHRFRDPLIVSALKGEGLGALEDRVTRIIQADMEDIEITLPHEHYALSRFIRETGIIAEEEYKEDGFHIKARVPRKIKFAIFKKLRS